MIKSSICELIGIEYPIFQGGMARISDGALAAAVSEAGGLGIVSAASGDVNQVAKELDIAKKLTDKPIGVNVMLRGENIEELAKLIAEKKPAVVTTGAGNPERYMDMWKSAGIKVIPVAASSSFAKIFERAGADAVVAEGCESGGHVGELTTMALVPQVCDAVSIPVIAAGGIADGRGAAAAFMLGAEGIQIGTRFLVAEECGAISRVYKEKVLKASDTSTIVTGKRLGHPVRSIKTAFSREYAKLEYTTISNDDLEQFAVGSLAAAVNGDEKKGCFLAGQISGLVNKEQTCAEIIKEIFEEAEELLRGGAKWVR